MSDRGHPGGESRGPAGGQASRSPDSERLAGLLQHAAELRRVVEQVEVACRSLERQLLQGLPAEVHEQVGKHLAQRRQHHEFLQELVAALEREAHRQPGGAAPPATR